MLHPGKAIDTGSARASEHERFQVVGWKLRRKAASASRHVQPHGKLRFMFLSRVENPTLKTGSKIENPIG